MKTAFLLVAASTLLSASLTHAADPCTASDLTAISSLPEFKALPTACGITSLPATSPADDLKNAYCKSDCINAMKALSKALPACATSGTSLTATYDAALKTCGSAAAPAAAPAPAKSGSAETNTASVAVGLVATALALARI